MLFAIGGFCLQAIYSPPNSIRKLLILVWLSHWMLLLVWCLPQQNWFHYSTDHSDIPSLADDSYCQHEAINTHVVCSFNMHSSAGHTCKQCTIIFSLFITIFNQKWLKHVNTTIGEIWLLGKSVWWQATHLSLANFFSKFSIINTLWYHWFHSTCAVENPISLISKFIYISWWLLCGLPLVV